MHRELVEERRWISERRFLHALNYCLLLPGPEAQQLATYLGWLLHRSWGGLVAGVLFVLPSFGVLAGLSWAYVVYGEVTWVAAVFAGIKPAVVALVALAAWRLGRRILHNVALAALAVAAFLALAVLRVPFPAIILGAGLAGVLIHRLRPDWLGAGQVHGATEPGTGAPALIGDDTPPPPHARFRPGRAVLVALGALLLWSSLYGALAAWQGADGTLPAMARFFTQAAFLTFGGAYAVLPYVYQAAVEQYGWLTTLQMLDGLALGETTPGPLIMVVAFVGFLGSWGAAAAQGLTPEAAGLLGAACATVFTFLPSFLFIFLGAPLVEATRGNLGFTAPLTAVTAAVVGVIAELALFFGRQVLLPDGLAGGLHWPSVVIGLLAGVALFRFRLGIVPVILGAGLLGLAAHAAGL